VSTGEAPARVHKRARGTGSIYAHDGVWRVRIRENGRERTWPGLPATLSRAELGDAAATLRRLLDAVSRGDLDAPAVTIRDLEAAARALEAVAQVLKPNDQLLTRQRSPGSAAIWGG